MSYETLMNDIKKLSPDEYNFVVRIVENLPKTKTLVINTDIVNKTNLSENRRRFLETAGKIDIDEDHRLIK